MEVTWWNGSPREDVFPKGEDVEYLLWYLLRLNSMIIAFVLLLGNEKIWVFYLRILISWNKDYKVKSRKNVLKFEQVFERWLFKVVMFWWNSMKCNTEKEQIMSVGLETVFKKHISKWPYNNLKLSPLIQAMPWLGLGAMLYLEKDCSIQQALHISIALAITTFAFWAHDELN